MAMPAATTAMTKMTLVLATRTTVAALMITVTSVEPLLGVAGGILVISNVPTVTHRRLVNLRVKYGFGLVVAGAGCRVLEVLRQRY